MNKTELVKAVADKMSVTHTLSNQAVCAIMESIAEALAKGEQVALPGFGSFKVTKRAARSARNPRTGETIHLPAAKSIGFKAGKELKSKVNG